MNRHYRYLIYNYITARYHAVLVFAYMYVVHIVDFNDLILPLNLLSVTHSNQGPTKLNAADEVHLRQEDPAF